MASESDHHGKDGKNKPTQGADPLSVMTELAGQAVNSALGAVTGFDAKTLVAQLPPESIASYLRGKNLDPSDANLSTQQKADLKIYTSLHDSLTASIPFYDHTAFVKNMEQEISERSQQQAIVDAKGEIATNISTAIASDSIKTQVSGASDGEDNRSSHNSPERLTSTKLPGLIDSGHLGQLESKVGEDSNSSKTALKADTRTQPKPPSTEPDKLFENRNSSSHSSSAALLADASYGVKCQKGDEIPEVNSQKNVNKEISGGKVDRAEFGSQKSSPITWDNVVQNNPQNNEASAQRYSLKDDNKLDHLNITPKVLIDSDSVKSITEDKANFKSAPNSNTHMDFSQTQHTAPQINVRSGSEKFDPQLPIQKSNQNAPNDNITIADGLAQPPRKNEPLTVRVQNSDQNADIGVARSSRESGAKPMSEGSVDQNKISGLPQRPAYDSRSSSNEKKTSKMEPVDQKSHTILANPDAFPTHDSIVAKKSPDLIVAKGSAFTSPDLKAMTTENPGFGNSSLRERTESFVHLLQTHGVSELRWHSALHDNHAETSKAVTYHLTGNWSTRRALLPSNIAQDKTDANNRVYSGPKLPITTIDKSCPRLVSSTDHIGTGGKSTPTIGNDGISAESSSLAGVTRTRFNPNEKRYILGSEIALAVIIAAAGASRIRTGVPRNGPRTELIPGSKPTESLTIRSEKNFNSVSDQHQSTTSELSEIDDENEFAAESSSEDKLQNVVYRQSSDSPMSITIDAVLEAPKESTITNFQSSDQTPVMAKKKKKTSSTPIIRPKALIASTDTLISIAEAFFYDRNVAWLIADLNQAMLKQTWMDGKRIVELKSRQQIELPVWDDIDKFYSSKPDYARPENLITIVEQSAIDSELLNSTLGRLFDPNQE